MSIYICKNSLIIYLKSLNAFFSLRISDESFSETSELIDLTFLHDLLRYIRQVMIDTVRL